MRFYRSSSGELFRELLKDNRSSSAVGESGREVGKEKTKKQDPCLELVVGDVITDKELNQVQSMVSIFLMCINFSISCVGNGIFVFDRTIYLKSEH